MKEFLIQKGDALLVLVKIRADFAIPTLSDIKAARLDSAKGTTMQPTTTRRRDPGVDTIAIEHISDDFIVPIENDDSDEQTDYELFLSRGAISMSWLTGTAAASSTGRQLDEAINAEAAKDRSSVLLRIVGAKTRGSAGKTTTNQLCIDHLRLVYGGGDAWFENTRKRIGRHYFHCCADPLNDTPEKLLAAMCNFANHLIGDHEKCSKREGKAGCTAERQQDIEAAMAECRNSSSGGSFVCEHKRTKLKNEPMADCPWREQIMGRTDRRDIQNVCL